MRLSCVISRGIVVSRPDYVRYGVRHIREVGGAAEIRQGCDDPAPGRVLVIEGCDESPMANCRVRAAMLIGRGVKMITMRRMHTGIASALLLFATASHASSEAAAEPVPFEAMLVEGGYGGFLDAHHDLRHHRFAMKAYFDGDYAVAMRHFRKAARYADKPSQSLIAEMLWEGRGVPRDRALAYAWMDLAAERGSRRFLIQRERYWNALDAVEQADAIARGAELYAEFGDAVAKGRLARALRRVSADVAGSKTGFSGNTVIHAAAVGSGAAPVTTGVNGGDTGFQPSRALPAVAFFTPRLWNPEQYFTWRDEYWERKLQSGVVEVGDVEKAPAASRGAPGIESDD
jgi:hypothetical protein